MVHERYLGREKRILPNESLGAVYRINEPEVLRIFLRAAGFLPVESMVRERVEDDATYGLFALDVGLRHRRHVFLGGYSEVPRVVRTADIRCS